MTCECQLFFDCRIALKRDSAVSKEVLSEISQTMGKKLTKAEKDER